MRVDMTPILNGKTDLIKFSFEWDGASELFPQLTFEKSILVVGDVLNRSGYMQLKLNAESEYSTECARCLEKIRRGFSFNLEKSVALKSEVNEEDDDTVIISDLAIELDELVEELLFLELPSRDICSEDCRGLCPKCGKNLNHESCGCTTKEVDPRLAVLKKFLDNEE